MEKSLIVKFIKEKHRGVYDAIVNEYSSIIIGWHISILRRVIEIDLEKHTGEVVKLNYFSLAKAVKNFKKKRQAPMKSEKASTPTANPRYDFKDAHELDEKKSTKPGSFKL